MNDQANEVTQQVQNKAGLLTDNQGKRSMMRLMSFIALIASICFAWMTLTDSNTTSNEGLHHNSISFGSICTKSPSKIH